MKKIGWKDTVRIVVVFLLLVPVTMAFQSQCAWWNPLCWLRPRLSNLIIDTDKDWKEHRIYDLGGIDIRGNSIIGEDLRTLWGFADLTKSSFYINRSFSEVDLREVILTLEGRGGGTYDKVGQLINVYSSDPGHNLWAQNLVVQLNENFTGDAYGLEIDVNNHADEVKGVGLGFSGMGKQNALAAIFIGRHQNYWAYGISIFDAIHPLYIVPYTAGAMAIVVRDSNNKEDVFKILENGDVFAKGFMWIGGDLRRLKGDAYFGTEEAGKKVVAFNWGEGKVTTLKSKEIEIDQKGINVPIVRGATKIYIKLPHSYKDVSYGVLVAPHWGTNIWISQKTPDSFVINFGTPPTRETTLDWFVYR
jgi:hypothetical protein